MANEDRMYELEYPAPAVNDTAAGETDGPTLIVALHGYADAGQAVEHSADHLKAALDNRLIASFNADELIDYRSRRPAVTLDNDAPMEIENLDLDMRVLRDNADKAFLLLSGPPEPDLRWQAFTKAVTDLVEKFDVKQTVALYGAPMPVPHTRPPMVITAHGNSPELVSRMFRLDSTMMVPGAAQMYIERALAKAGRNVAGYTAHVPHYLANSPYPQATLELLESVASVTGLKLPLRALEADAARLNHQIEEQVNDSEEIAQVVGQLENQYDAIWSATARSTRRPSCRASRARLPAKSSRRNSSASSTPWATRIPGATRSSPQTSTTARITSVGTLRARKSWVVLLPETRMLPMTPTIRAKPSNSRRPAL